MSELEEQRFRAKREELIFNRKQDQMKKQQLVYDYRIHVTNDIMNNATDFGVTVCMPHVMDEKLLDNLTEAGSQKKMSSRAHAIVKITKEDLEMINFDGENMSPLLFNWIRDQDVLIIAWKIETGELRPIHGN